MPSASSFPSSSTSLSVPVSRCYITHLLNALPALAYSSVNPVNSDFSSAAAVGALTPPNPLTAAPDQVKKQLLALQVVFPNEFLPALDLLDRRLVTRFQINRKGDGKSNKARLEENAADRRLNSAVAGIRGTEDLGSDGQQRGETETIEASKPSCEDAGLLNPRLSPTQRPSFAEAKGHTLAQDANAASLRSKEVPLTDTLRGNPEEGEQQSLHQPLRTSAEQILPIDSKDTVYYVRSAQQHSSRYAASYDATTYYEVRLQAWNCSCPAFAFAAFPPAHPEPPVQGHNPSETLDGNMAPDNQPVEAQWVFGGISLGEGIPPVCKHLLACVLAERCGTLFGGFIERRDVSVEEAAGWAAGWGD